MRARDGSEKLTQDADNHSNADIVGDDSKEWEFVGPDMSDEEVLERLKSNQRNYTTAEVLAHLGRIP